MMRPGGFVETAIAAHHDRRRFDCGSQELNFYLQRYARQNHAKGGSKCFVAVDPERPERVLGYYTISPASLAFARTPPVLQRGLARYEVPVFRLGRLAVDLTVQGQGLGSKLLLAAGERALLVSEQVGGIALLIDAKDARAAAYYESHGAVALHDTELSLILPLSVIAAALSATPP